MSKLSSHKIAAQNIKKGINNSANRKEGKDGQT